MAEKKGFFGDHEPEPFEQVWFDDCVGNAGLMFQSDKNKSLGRNGTLTGNDVAGALNDRTMLRLDQVGRALSILEIFAQQFHQMRPRR